MAKQPFIPASSEGTHASTATLVASATFAILLGCFFVFGVGFASPTMLHNAAHDTRHSFAFPCH